MHCNAVSEHCCTRKFSPECSNMVICLSNFVLGTFKWRSMKRNVTEDPVYNLVLILLWAKSYWTSKREATIEFPCSFFGPQHILPSLNSIFKFLSSKVWVFFLLTRRDDQVSLPGGRCQFTPSIFCYSSPLGVNETWAGTDIHNSSLLGLQQH